MSFYTSLTGLNSATKQLSVTSNNIANVGTTAFKRSRVDFGDIFSTSALQKSSSLVGQGVLTKAVSQEFTQGNISTSGSALDMSITGDGFFPMKTADGTGEIYSRNGSFMLNELNQVVNSQGARLQAAAVDSAGKADTGDMGILTIPSRTVGDAEKTTQMDLALNLPADAKVITAAFDRDDPTTYNESTSMTVYDTAGTAYLATVYYVKTKESSTYDPETKWQTHFYVGDSEFEPRLQQATNADGEYMFMNKYGDITYNKNPVSTAIKFKSYRLDDNMARQESAAASLVATNEPDDDASKMNFDVANGTFASGVDLAFDVTVDGLNKTFTYTTPAPGDDVDELVAGINAAMAAVLGGNADDGDATTIDNVYGAKFEYRGGVFTFTSGSTGDTSSIKINSANLTGTQIDGAEALGFTDGQEVAAVTDGAALRGKESLPAVLTTDAVTLLPNGRLALEDNITFAVNVDGYQGEVELNLQHASLGANPLPENVAARLQALIDADTDINFLGITVEYDSVNKTFSFTSGSTGGEAFVEVVPGDAANIFGLAGVTSAYGQTSTWVSLEQNTDSNNTALYTDFSDGYYKEGSDSSGAVPLTSWPVFLDPGELTFNSSGELISPVTSAMPWTASQAGTAVGSMKVNLAGSNMSGSVLTILGQNQDGSPEGDLMGIDIGDDGLVTASYSNGKQKALGKVVLANFTNAAGLRQMGDSSFLASGTSGVARLGEAGSAGFGSVRSGSIERSNVDLTQELVDLIAAQRNFQANAKAIETSNTLTQAIMNIRG